jgi:hypothetical protein
MKVREPVVLEAVEQPSKWQVWYINPIQQKYFIDNIRRLITSNGFPQPIGTLIILLEKVLAALLFLSSACCCSCIFC